MPCDILQADEPLGTFLDYCTYGHMIDNVVLLVTGTLHERDVTVSFPSSNPSSLIYQSIAASTPCKASILCLTVLASKQLFLTVYSLSDDCMDNNILL